MSILSKLLEYPFSCYEVAHPWTPSCSRSWLDVGVPGFFVALKIYFPLFVVSKLINYKSINRNTPRKVLLESLQSSLFLGANCYFFVASFCVIRRPLPFLPLTWSMLAAGVLGSLVAILVERGARRSALAVYMLNIASEAVARALVARGIVPHVPGGRRLLAVTGLTALLLLHKLGRCDGLLGAITGGLLGGSEVVSSGGPGVGSRTQTELSAGGKMLRFVATFFRRRAESSRLISSVDPPRVEVENRSGVCKHAASCPRYIFSGFVESFSLGAAGQLGLLSVRNLLRLFRWLGGRRARRVGPLQLLAPSRHHLGAGLCLGSLCGVFRLVCCLLRRLRGYDDPTHALPAGLLATSVALRFFRNSSLELYLFWKTAEAWCRLAVERGWLPRLLPESVAIILIYSLSTGAVLALAALEPHHIRPSYWSFLRQLTDNHVTMLNRPLMHRHCGTDSVRLPDVRRAVIRLLPDHVRPSSRRFIEQLGQL